jgi:cobalt-zinc-cadmium resistance protein CzcA
LKELADQAAAVLQQVEGASDVKVEQISGMLQLDVRINRETAARHGISMADINGTIELAVAGRQATTLIEEQRRIAVVLRYPEANRSTQAELERLLVAAPGGERVPLGQLAEFELVETPTQVSRENGMRRVVAEANVRDRDLGGFVAEVQERMQPLVKSLPTGYHLEYGGQFENQQRAMRQLALVVPVALLLILVLLYLALGSIGSSLLVLLNLPFSLVGGILAVVIFRMPLSVSAAVAFIVLLGVAVQNGVVLVAFFRQLRERGESIEDTIHIGCDLRFRPLLMTALTSFIGHLPMLYATGSGADIQKPLAVVVMGGLVTSTLLTLIVLPTLYLTAHRWRRGRLARLVA